MTVWVFRPLIALSLAAVLAVGCSKKQSAEEQAEQAKATEDHILLGQIAAAAAQQGGGQMGGNGGQQMMGQGQGQMMGQGQG